MVSTLLVRNPSGRSNISPNKILDVSNPESYEDLVELLVPVLQKRGLMWDDYTVPGGTYRENLLGTPGQSLTPEGHPSTQFRYDVLKKTCADSNGDITIEKRDPEPVVEATPAPATSEPAPIPEVVKEETPVTDAEPVIEPTPAPKVEEEKALPIIEGVSVPAEKEVTKAEPVVESVPTLSSEPTVEQVELVPAAEVSPPVVEATKTPIVEEIKLVEEKPAEVKIVA